MVANLMMSPSGESKKTSVTLDLIGGTKFARYEQMTVEETMNMMVTGVDSDSPALVPFSGYKEVLDFGRGQARALFLSTRLNELIVVIGSTVYVVTDFLGARVVGSIDSTIGPVHVTENFNSQIAIEDGNKIYIYDYANSTFSTPVIDFVPVYIDFQDSYFIATGTNGKWYISDTNNGLIWSPLDSQSMQTKADRLQAAKVLDRQLWIMGEKVCELWQDQGQQLFPYVRENTIAIDYGVVNRETIAEGFGILVWLAKNEKSNPSLVYTSGGKPEPFSTEGLDFILSELENPEDSVGFLFQQDGHTFYQIAFPSDNFSIVFDFNTKMFYTVTDECRNYHIAKSVVLFRNKLYFISLNDAKLYEMSTDITTYNGLEVPRIRVLRHYRDPDNKTFVVNRVGLQMEQGNNSGVSRVDLSISKDDGVNFGSVVGQNLMRQGKRRGKVDFWRMGRADSITLQFRFSSKERFVITNGTMDLFI
jgi:hypothetical protein